MKEKRALNLKRQAVQELVKSAEGQIFGVSFVKLDGSLRRMQARLGVTQHLRGGENTVAHIPKYLTAYDMKVRNYRNINLDTLQELKLRGQRYKIVE